MTISEIAQNGFVYGYASVDLYRILHDFALDPHAAEFKAPLNTFGHARGVASAEDRTVVAMNVDTPYSYAWLDLRAEPVVVTLPSFEADRYVSAMFVDLATYILGYVSPRTNGNRGGRFLVTGPGWSGDVPPGIDGIFACPTELCLVFLRTQLFGPDDQDRVAAIQDGCDVQPLSVFLGQPRRRREPVAAAGRSRRCAKRTGPSVLRGPVLDGRADAGAARGRRGSEPSRRRRSGALPAEGRWLGGRGASRHG